MNVHAMPNGTSATKRIAVIGGGLGGLAAACVASARGHDVTVFDKNDWFGGKAAVFEEDGFRFDMGPTILTVPRVLRRIYAEAGRDQQAELPLIRLDPQWRCFFDDNTRIDLLENVEAMARAMDQFAPGTGQGAGYRRFQPRMWGLLERDLAAPGLEPVRAWFERNVPESARAAAWAVEG